ncbi:MAG: hypothetical protein RLZZ135_1792 [Cyanobacteriota bacterium]|jgi:hypothetical protein
MSHFSALSSLSYQGFSIDYHHATGLICLTDLWHAQSSPTSERPLAWVRMETTQVILKRLAQQTTVEPLWSERQHSVQGADRLIVGVPGILETVTEDGDLRTYATTNLSIVYANFLASECHEWAMTNLTPGSAPIEQIIVPQSPAKLQQQRRTFNRRAVILAGWSIPVVSVLSLNQQSAAAVSSGGNNTTSNNKEFKKNPDGSTTIITTLTNPDGTKSTTSETIPAGQPFNINQSTKP